MADGVVIDEDYTNDELDYEQSIVFSAGALLEYGRGADRGDEVDPILYVDFSSATYDVVITLKDTMNFSAMGDSEKIELLGREYTVKPNLASGATEDLILLGSDESVMLELGETKTIGGIDYTLTAANADSDNAILKVGSSQKTIYSGNTYTIGGQEVYVKSLYISTIPTTSASVEIMVGSQEMKINGGSMAALKVNDETVKGVSANVTGGTSEATEIRFTVTPSNINDDSKYLEVGTEFVDPVFGFKLAFTGMSEELDAASKSNVNLDIAGDIATLTFTNEDGDEYSVDVYTINATGGIEYAEDFVALGTALTEDSEFIVPDSTGDVSYVYKVVEFDEEDTKNTTTIKDLSTGKETVLEVNDFIGDSVRTVTAISALGKSVTVSTGGVISAFEIENDGLINLTAPANITGTIGGVGAKTQAYVWFTESNYAEELTVADTDTIVATLTDVDSTSAYEIGISSIADAGSTDYSTSDKAGDVEYILTEFGTYVVYDAEDKGYMNLYYPQDREVDYFVSVAGGDASTSQATKEYSEGDVLKGIGTITAITAGSVTGGSFNVNPIGSLGVLDTDTTIGKTNQIIVGGPAVNRLAAEAVGVSYPSYGLSSGLLEGEGEAVIKLVEKGTKVALVVAGWEAADTQRATNVLANYGMYSSKLSGMEVKVTGTVASPVISLVVEDEEVAEEEVAEE